jgi:hypothetical protein
MSSNDWKWHGEDAMESIVVKPVQAVAVYTNPHGEIVIRQQDTMGEDDSVIVIPKSAVNALVKAIRAEAAKPFIPEPTGS